MKCSSPVKGMSLQHKNPLPSLRNIDPNSLMYDTNIDSDGKLNFNICVNRSYLKVI